MKKMLALLLVFSLSFGSIVTAQEETAAPDSSTEQVDTSAQAEADTNAVQEESKEEVTPTVKEEPAEVKRSFTEVIKDKFIEGG